MGQIVAFNAINISIRWGDFRGKTAIMYAISQAVKNSMIKAVADAILKMQIVVPERTGRLLQGGIQTLTDSLSIALTRKNRFQLKLGWKAFYATFVELFPKESTNWTKATSDPDYRRITYAYLTDKFAGYLFEEIQRQNNRKTGAGDIAGVFNVSDLNQGSFA